MAKEERRIQNLAHKWMTGTLDRAEEREFNEWLDEDEEWITEIPEELAVSEAVHRKSLFSKIEQQIGEGIVPSHRSFSWKQVAWASVILLLFIPTVFLISRQLNSSTPNNRRSNPEDIAPGGNKAFLTLGNGKKICLTDVATGSVVKQDGVEIKKLDDGQLVYSVERPTGRRDQKQKNTIETPKGGQYQVILPDGSLVWLNAASRLTYDTALDQEGNREVFLEGEAYFEVKEDKQHPFLVQLEGQQVEVLGTHFNINNYGDRSAMETTLLSGSVRVRALHGAVVLRPGQQSLSNATIQVSDGVDTEEVVAWKNGQFYFKDAGIPEVMKQVERWYDVLVRYEGELPKAEFNGRISRNISLSKFLEMLAYTGVHFDTEEKTITVKAYH